MASAVVPSTRHVHCRINSGTAANPRTRYEQRHRHICTLRCTPNVCSISSRLRIDGRDFAQQQRYNDRRTDDRLSVPARARQSTNPAQLFQFAVLIINLSSHYNNAGVVGTNKRGTVARAIFGITRTFCIFGYFLQCLLYFPLLALPRARC